MTIDLFTEEVRRVEQKKRFKCVKRGHYVKEGQPCKACNK